ncbi:hypothetical protein GH714_018644 [Hevea brasiliensis]|uniref:Myeloid leukemia factor n=1 Tax=Hevea brasiliensis TaxID=3981 RepID=A0A6A6LCB7_HEVBR|nr:hypothetical protein GH714_018606 [Hevea brasiliensis]KAF2298214.1 hypothetical protein GH714_018644 [Hevea brasiliensis]
MQREREGRNDFFGKDDPFSNFRGFGMMPSLFGGKDPFDDPFFTRPFGSMFESTRLEPPNSGSSDALHANGANELVIEELVSDDKEEKEKDIHSGSGKEPFIEYPDDDFEEVKSKNVNCIHDDNKMEGTKPQARNFSFQTCKVTYGGVDGAYYTSTRTRRAGSDGVVIEENKEVDKSTGQATHQISRGLHDKGHSVTRKLNSDGKVDTSQTLHNLNEDEVAAFEEAWNGNVKGQLPGLSNQFDINGNTACNDKIENGNVASSNREQKEMTTWGRWALPSVEHHRNTGVTSAGKSKTVLRINIE